EYHRPAASRSVRRPLRRGIRQGSCTSGQCDDADRLHLVGAVAELAVDADDEVAVAADRSRAASLAADVRALVAVVGIQAVRSDLHVDRLERVEAVAAAREDRADRVARLRLRHLDRAVAGSALADAAGEAVEFSLRSLVDRL